MVKTRSYHWPGDAEHIQILNKKDNTWSFPIKKERYLLLAEKFAEIGSRWNRKAYTFQIALDHMIPYYTCKCETHGKDTKCDTLDTLSIPIEIQNLLVSTFNLQHNATATPFTFPRGIQSYFSLNYQDGCFGAEPIPENANWKNKHLYYFTRDEKTSDYFLKRAGRAHN